MRLRTLLAALGFALAVAAAQAATELNAASQAELEQLKGIGPALSERILAERERAPFRDWSDFMQRVKGVRAAMAQRLSEAGLRVAGQAYPAPQ